MNTAKQTVIPILLLLITAIAFASVFAYYPLQLTVSPQAPGIKFEAGSNANQPDLGGKTITVNIGNNQTLASVTINPTYQENYYKNVLRLKNADQRAMNVWIIFTSRSNGLPQSSIVKMFIYDDATKIAEISITNSQLNSPISIGNMAVNKVWQIDFYVYIPEGTSITGASFTVSAKLVYSPSSETPPATPSS